VTEAIEAELQAKRCWTRTRMEHKWAEFQAASSAKRKAIAKAKQAYWRAGVHKAATTPKGIWKLAKWACTKSYLPKEPAKMLNLKWNGSIASTVRPN